MFAGAIFDVLDGLAARALGGGSELGKQLDSLADMVTFGVAPAIIVWGMFTIPQGPLGRWVLPMIANFISPEEPQRYWLIGGASLSIAVASAWRLARFNIDTRQTAGFLGLPTPFNAAFWCSLALIWKGSGVLQGPGAEVLSTGITDSLMEHAWLPLAIGLVLAILMLSSIPLPGLKFKHFQWRGNEVIFLLLGVGALLVVLYGILAVPLLLVLYLLSPLWGRMFGKRMHNTPQQGA